MERGSEEGGTWRNLGDGKGGGGRKVMKRKDGKKDWEKRAKMKEEGGEAEGGTGRNIGDRKAGVGRKVKKRKGGMEDWG